MREKEVIEVTEQAPEAAPELPVVEDLDPDDDTVVDEGEAAPYPYEQGESDGVDDGADPDPDPEDTAPEPEPEP